MSKTKHTPGPWTVGGNPDMDYDPLQLGFYKIFAVDGIGEANAHEDFIAKVNVNFRSHEANARLIAAAPELLDALKYATDALSGGLWDYGPGQDEHEKCNEVLESCRAVIAKATGGST